MRHIKASRLLAFALIVPLLAQAVGPPGGIPAVEAEPGATPAPAHTATPPTPTPAPTPGTRPGVGVGTVRSGGAVLAQPTPAPTPCPTRSGIAVLRACVGNVATTGVTLTEDPFDQPEGEPALFNLSLPHPVNTTVAYNQTFEVGQPAVTFNFPINIDPNQYADVRGRIEPNVVWSMQITAEACLTSEEAANWPGADNLNTACDPEVNARDAARGWYAVGKFDTNDLRLVQNQVQTGQNATVQVNLQQILTPMEFHYVGHDLTCCNTIDTETEPVNVIVLPAALMQLKVIPFTIMYVPPGNASQASVAMTTTYTTTQSAGTTTSIDNTNKQDNWVQQEQGLHIGDKIYGILGIQFDLSSSDKWDKSTTIATGQQASLSRSDTVSTETALTLGVDPPPSDSTDPAPGSAGTFDTEAFWNDLIVVIPHPQFGLWDFYGVMSMQMLGAASAGTEPHFPIRLRDLDACANAQAPFTNGFPIQDTSVVLSASDCQALAELDPFWGKGQSVDLTDRARQIGIYPYGVDPSDPINAPGFVNIADTWDQKLSTTDSSTTTYRSTVEEIHSSQGAEGLTVTLGKDGGGKGGDNGGGDNGDNGGGDGGPQDKGSGVFSMTFSYGSSLTESKTMGVEYSSSTTETNDNSLQVTGSVTDRIDRGFQPYVEVWQDDLFDTPMYRDPDAPAAP